MHEQPSKFVSVPIKVLLWPVVQLLPANTVRRWAAWCHAKADYLEKR